MKKIFLIIIIVIILLAFRDINNTYNKLYTKVEDEIVYIDELYTYGRYLNIKGHSNFELNNPELILLNDKLDEKNYKLNSNEKFFYITDKINDGINLETINESYTILIKNNEKFYTLKNETNYQETEYYSLSKQNKTNHITLLFETFKDKPFLKLKLKNIDTPDNIYDIVIDPGHGGMDGGASAYGYSERDFTFQIAKKIQDRLISEGYKVKLTREEDQLTKNDLLDEYGIHGRAVISSEVKAKYLFSVHMNSNANHNVNGLEVYTAKNINYDFAKKLVENINTYTGLNYSINKINKVFNSVYSRNFTDIDIQNSLKDYEKKGMNAYDISTNSNYYYMIRETGGIVTGAYVDDRNEEQEGNDYYNSNIGAEAYLLEMCYLSNSKDMEILDQEKDKYISAISDTINDILLKKV